MSREDFSFTSTGDGVEIACYRWPASTAPVGIVQIAHGMGEHALRYEHVAAFLCGAGYHVYANDHRGHGRTAGDSRSYGDLGAGGWNALVADLAAITRLARTRDGGLPIILLGHSMGSFAAQQYMIDYADLIAGVILSGTASLAMLPIDPSQEADLSAFNVGFEPARTPYDWLSRDPAVVDAYVADPACGFGLNPRSLQGMAEAARRLTDPAEIARIPSGLPIYILAGERDPINYGLEWVKPLAEQYRAAGITNVTEKYYPEGRHEMLNEINRDQVLADLLTWVRRCVAT